MGRGGAGRSNRFYVATTLAFSSADINTKQFAFSFAFEAVPFQFQYAFTFSSPNQVILKKKDVFFGICYFPTSELHVYIFV